MKTLQEFLSYYKHLQDFLCEKTLESQSFSHRACKGELLAKYLDAVAKFPRPTNITDVRSFFGLICQLAHYAQLRDLMAPFLSPRTKFEWSDELEEKFIAARKEIVAAIEKGVEIFEPGRQTGHQSGLVEEGDWLLPVPKMV